MSPSNAASFANVRAIVLDVDGTLTDGGVFWGPDGQEWKRFCFADIMGVSRARRAGLGLALISGEDSPLIDRFAQKLKIEHVYKGIRDKATALEDFSKISGFKLEEICFMGDDINDLSAMQLAGCSAAPADAQPPVRAFVTLVTQARGGYGAVREMIELVLTHAENHAQAL
jgi:3-deoxy-D-manno-octulosonate 8-phosphate phosphatase (KDO 8-P phosphatase)